MSCPESESEEIDAALPPPGFTTPTKRIRNDGGGHGEPDAEGTDAESDSDVEKKIRRVDGQSYMKDVFDIWLKW